MCRVREKRRVEERRSEKRKTQKKEDAGARKGRKAAKHSVFPMICGSGGSKSRLAKAAGAKPSGQMRDENCTPLWREAHFEVKMHKTHQLRTTLGSCDGEKVRISKSKCTKHTSSGPLLEVAMSKKCTPLWRQAHLQVKKLKTPHIRTTFGSCAVEKVHAIVARSTFRSQNVQNTTCSRHFWRFRCCFAWQAQGIVHLNVGFCSISNSDVRCGAFEEDLQRCIFRGGAVQKTCS